VICCTFHAIAQITPSDIFYMNLLNYYGTHRDSERKLTIGCRMRKLKYVVMAVRSLD
jgi:hypothetical protein